jgi:hypothetical protein
VGFERWIGKTGWTTQGEKNWVGRRELAHEDLNVKLQGLKYNFKKFRGVFVKF